MAARRQDTSGLDVCLVLIRLLLSLGWGIDIDDSRPESATELQSLLYKTAWANLGLDREKDWELKEVFVRAIGPKKSGSSSPSTWTFMELFHHEDLQNIYIDNKQFQLVSDDFFQRLLEPIDSEWEHTNFWYRSPELRRANDLRWDGSNTLQECIGSLWSRTRSDGYERQLVNRRPHFLQIHYSPARAPFRHISKLRVLKFGAPEANFKDGRWIYDVQHAEYNLTAVVRLTDGETPDDIRTYWKTGHEIVPPEVGLFFKSKDPYAAPEKQWTIQAKGDYVLYYYRVEKNDGWLESEVEIDAPEFERRPWVTRDEPEERTIARPNSPRQRATTPSSAQNIVPDEHNTTSSNRASQTERGRPRFRAPEGGSHSGSLPDEIADSQ